MKRNELIDKTDILLFDILETLNSIAGHLTSPIKEDTKVEVAKDNQTTKPNKATQDDKIDKEENKKLYDCKHCGGTHEKSIDIVNCGKKQKKNNSKKK